MTTVLSTPATVATSAAATERVWFSLHCFLRWHHSDVDTFLTDTIAPWLNRLRDSGDIADWFFIRYLEGGPHLRIRVRDPRPGVADRIHTELTTLVADAPYQLAPDPPQLNPDQPWPPPDWYDHGDVREVPYRPEVARYGGPAAIGIAEDVFGHSTQVAIRLIATTGSVRARLAAAVELAMATALGLGLDRLAASRWLRAHAVSWRWQSEVAMLPPTVAQTHAVRLVERQAGTLLQTWQRLQEQASQPAAAADPARQWGDPVRAARRRLTGVEDPATTPENGLWLAVWASQLHMLFNRLGITPDEERSVCWLVAMALLAPDGLPSFFADGPDAWDRRFMEASKYLPGQFEAQRPSTDTDPPQPANWWAMGTPVRLPEHDLTVSLADALRRRGSARGRVVGPLTAGELGTVLWRAYGTTGIVPVTLPDGRRYELARRPYPSGGQQYPAQLRLVVWDIPGLEPGVYHADPVEKVLWRLGAAPSVDDLEATSSWFGEAAVAQGGIDLTELPALLGLYVDVSQVRQRYGLRTPRLVLVEAGHLAQNLALVAAGTGLALGMIGGFYDDLANEVFGLDGVDQMLVYLLPLGRYPRPGGNASPKESPGRQG